MPSQATIIGRLFAGLFFEIIYAPVWWYSRGLIWFIKRVGLSIKETSVAAGLGLWVRNLFVPMYGQHDAWGRIMSFFVRFTNIIARSLWVGLWVLLCLVAICVWVALPPIIFFIFMSALIRRAYV